MEKQTDKERETELLKHFDSIFDTDTLKTIKFDNMAMLKALFDYFEEFLYKPSEKYDKLRRQHIEVADLLENSFTERTTDIVWEILGIRLPNGNWRKWTTILFWIHHSQEIGRRKQNWKSRK